MEAAEHEALISQISRACFLLPQDLTQGLLKLSEDLRLTCLSVSAPAAQNRQFFNYCMKSIPQEAGGTDALNLLEANECAPSSNSAVL